MALADPWALELLLAAFAGGAFGAAIGALPSFALAGAMVIVGESYAMVHASLDAPAPVDITDAVAFGPVLGPHVAFGGGAAALAYAARRGDLDTDFAFHEAKHVTRGLGSRADVLAVGGLFGVAGHAIAAASATAGVPTDPVALGVVGSAVLHRAVLGYSVIGAPVGGWLDMTPYERGERRDGQRGSPTAATDGGHGPDGEGRYAVEPWLPYQYRWRDVLVLGAAVGLLGGYLAYATGSAFLAFGISVAALVFLNADVAAIPVTHHMSLPASTVVVAAAGGGAATPAPATIQAAVPLGEALLLGGALGVVGAFLGELLQRLLYAHAETHLDPPAASIVVTSVAIGVAASAGLLPGAAWIPLP